MYLYVSNIKENKSLIRSGGSLKKEKAFAAARLTIPLITLPPVPHCSTYLLISHWKNKAVLRFTYIFDELAQTLSLLFIRLLFQGGI